MKKFFTLCIISLFISAEIFAIGPWTQKASMEGSGRHRPFSMTIGSRGYVGGGWDGMQMFYDCWEYDPSTNSWTQKADCPNVFWSDPAFGIGTKGFVVNGTDTYMFNPLNNTWTIVNTTSLGSSGWDQMKFVANGKGYIMSTDDIYEFDPTVYTWTYKTTITNFWPDLAFTANNKAYLLDSWNNIFYEYNPVNNAVVWKAPCIAQLSQAVSFGVNGKGYIGTGQVAPFNDDVSDFYEYDPALNSWRGINPFIGAGRENATAFVIGSKGYVTCGTSGINFNDIYEFDNFYVTGIDENELASAVSIYPNPSIDGKYFVKEGSTTIISSLQVFDMKGQEVKTISMHGEGILDMQELPNGEYFVVLLNKENKKCGTKKIILAK